MAGALPTLPMHVFLCWMGINFPLLLSVTQWTPLICMPEVNVRISTVPTDSFRDFLETLLAKFLDYVLN
jgi:hypothetical protein